MHRDWSLVGTGVIGGVVATYEGTLAQYNIVQLIWTQHQQGLQ